MQDFFHQLSLYHYLSRVHRLLPFLYSSFLKLLLLLTHSGCRSWDGWDVKGYRPIYCCNSTPINLLLITVKITLFSSVSPCVLKGSIAHVGPSLGRRRRCEQSQFHVPRPLICSAMGTRSLP